ncbi:MAG: hypothetical protein SXV54_00250 [Chloroflexota bacterium]|nr:hypothetical protein [Chloroflexota bacterium]
MQVVYHTPAGGATAHRQPPSAVVIILGHARDARLRFGGGLVAGVVNGGEAEGVEVAGDGGGRVLVFEPKQVSASISPSRNLGLVRVHCAATPNLRRPAAPPFALLLFAVKFNLVW